MDSPEALKETHETHESDRSDIWREMAANTGSFNPAAAEAKRALDGEKMETVSTDQYEKEIRALGERFEEPAFLNDEIEMPSDMDLVKMWVEERRHSGIIQGWVQSRSNSPEEQTYKNSLASAGFRRKLFYRQDPEFEKEFQRVRDEYKEGIIQEKTNEFLNRQDRIEWDVRSELRSYDTEPDNPVAKMEGEDLPLPSRFELIRSWVEDSTPSETGKHIDQIKEWLISDDGDDKEKRYRALMRVRLSGGIKRWERHGGFRGEIEKSSIHETLVPYNIARSGFDRSKFMSPEYSALSDEEKAKKWEEAKVEYVELLKKERAERKRREEEWAAKRAEAKQSTGANKKPEWSDDEQRPIETTSLPDQGPNALSPLFNEYPMDPFGTMFN